MASVEEVKANVAASVDGTRRAVAGIQQVTDQLDDALAGLDQCGVLARHGVRRPPDLAGIAVVGAQFPLGLGVAQCRA